MAAEQSSTTNAPRLVGWITGAFSLLNLVEDLTPLELFGKLAHWAAAYALFVKRLGALLFGWIHFGWVSVSELEKHLLIIASVYSAAFTRALVPFIRRRTWNTSAICFSLLFTTILMPALFLPEIWGLIGGATVFGFWLIFLFAKERHETADQKATPGGRHIRQELAGVGITFALLVALNYAWFR